MSLNLTNKSPGEIIGRLLISAIFLISAYQKITGFSGTLSYMSHGTFPATLIPHSMLPIFGGIAIFIELIVALAFLIGYQLRWTSLILAVYVFVASFMFHAFWLASASAAYGQQLHFLKNMAIVGGLLVISAHAWRYYKTVK